MTALLPQLDYATYSSQIFWLAITFFILYFSISRSFLPNVINLVQKRKKYIDDIQEKISDKEEMIAGMHELHSSLISSKNEEVSKKIREANQKASDIIAYNNEIIQQNINALQDSMLADLNGVLNVSKPGLEQECNNVIELFSKKLNLDFKNENLEVASSGNFEKRWFNEIKKLKS